MNRTAMSFAGITLAAPVITLLGLIALLSAIGALIDMDAD